MFYGIPNNQISVFLFKGTKLISYFHIPKSIPSGILGKSNFSGNGQQTNILLNVSQQCHEIYQYKLEKITTNVETDVKNYLSTQ